jgi:hypothetical protein
MFRQMMVVIAVVGLCGCQRERPEVPRRNMSIETPHGFDPIWGVPEPYHLLSEPGVPFKDIESAWKKFPYSKIELGRTGCYGECPDYSVTLQAGGAASYHGRHFVEKTGHFTGEVEFDHYGRLCWMIEKFGILSGPQSYRASWTDDATVYVNVTLRETGETIQISDYGHQGPIELWAVFQSIDGVAHHITWKANPAP